jgi:hypothetical protein
MARLEAPRIEAQSEDVFRARLVQDDVLTEVNSVDEDGADVELAHANVRPAIRAQNPLPPRRSPSSHAAMQLLEMHRLWPSRAPDAALAPRNTAAFHRRRALPATAGALDMGQLSLSGP